MNKLKMNEPFNQCQKVFDFAILGGGIVGSSISISLQKAGFSTILIEKSDLSKFKPGESLSPECKKYLNQIKISLEETFAVEYYGISSVWGSSYALTKNFIFNPYGNGISIERKEFEQRLIKHAEVLGSKLLIETIVRRLTYNNKYWEIFAGNNLFTYLIKCRFLIFATGRISPLNEFKFDKTYLDKLIAFTIVINSDHKENFERNLFIEALPNGWFYTNILPGNKRVITFFTDSDLLSKSNSKSYFFMEEVRKTTWYKQNKFEFNNCDYLSLYDARTSWSANQSGRTWIALGDAAYTIDPLSGQGFKKNFEMISFCMQNISSFLDQHSSVTEKYTCYNESVFSKFLSEKTFVYNLEQRWKSKEFWRRRNLMLW